MPSHSSKSKAQLEKELNEVKKRLAVYENCKSLKKYYDLDCHYEEKFRLNLLLDMKPVQKMAEANFKANGMPVGILDANNGDILVQVGWQEICTNFHRVHPVSRQRCIESDTHIASMLKVNEVAEYKCGNGLWDIGIPVIVFDNHIANIFLGQFFFEEEKPDRDFFIDQAQKLGFDTEAYLKALQKVPKFSKMSLGLEIPRISPGPFLVFHKN